MGSLIHQLWLYMRTRKKFWLLPTLILALLGVILFWIVDRIERLVIPWHVSQRENVVFAA